MIPARIRMPATQVICRLLGHDSSWRYAVSIGLLTHPVCRRCGRDCPR